MTSKRQIKCLTTHQNAFLMKPKQRRKTSMGTSHQSFHRNFCPNKGLIRFRGAIVSPKFFPKQRPYLISTYASCLLSFSLNNIWIYSQVLVLALSPTVLNEKKRKIQFDIKVTYKVLFDNHEHFSKNNF